LYVFGKIMYPFIWVMNGSARVFLRLFGVQPAGHEQAHSEEELKIIMSQSFKSGEINQTELALMQNVFTFDERVTKDIMVPRMNVTTLSLSMTWAEVLQVMTDNQYTRYPVIEDFDKDKIIGYVNVKEVLTDQANDQQRDLRKYLKDIPAVSEITPLQETLLKMKVTRSHIALVIDEYGGTAGMIAMEDLLEEIVGEIRDEFDEDEQADIETVSKTEYQLSGTVLLADLVERFNLTFTDADEIDTIAGFIQARGTDYQVGERHETEAYDLELLHVENYQIQQVKLVLKQIS